MEHDRAHRRDRKHDYYHGDFGVALLVRIVQYEPPRAQEGEHNDDRDGVCDSVTHQGGERIETGGHADAGHQHQGRCEGDRDKAEDAAAYEGEARRNDDVEDEGDNHVEDRHNQDQG